MGGLFGALARHEDIKMTSQELDYMIRAGHHSAAGTVVSWHSALAVSTVLACCKVIAEGIAQVPFKLFLRAPSRSAADDHPLYDLLYRRPNDWQTSFQFRETLAFHLLLTGNAFASIARVGNLRTIHSLMPIEPGSMSVCREPDGRLRYWETRPAGDRVERDPADIWHIRGPSWNSWMGMEAVKLAREAIGLTMAIEQSQGAVHRNGAQISGLYSINETLKPDQFTLLSTWLERYERGGDKEGKRLILDRGATFSPMQMSGRDAETLETRKHQVEEICRTFRVMPIMVGQADKAATYASSEQMFLAHVVHTLMPWYERLEQSADVSLLTPQERQKGYYTKFNPNALMRGAAKDRAEFYAKALGAGGSQPWMMADEVRENEDMDPVGGHAAELGQPVQTAPGQNQPQEGPA
jgi:HK97 family phage portal protein